MSKNILVLGATGHVGEPLISQLVDTGQGVHAASRRATPVPGATAVRFDYADRASYERAFEGVDRAFVMLPGGYTNAVAFLQPVIQAAADRKVKVVLQTAIGVDADENIPYRQVELFLMQRDVSFVILRPNWFSDNFHNFWLDDIKRGMISVPAGEGRSSFIDIRDVAACAAAALTSDRFDGKAFNLTGPQALSYDDVAAVLSKVSGRTITYTPVDDETFVERAASAGLPREYAAFLASIFLPVRQGWTSAVTGDVQALTGRAPRSFEQYAADHRRVFAIS